MRLDRSRTHNLQVIGGFTPLIRKKEKHPLFSECPEQITGDEAKTVNKRFR